MKTLDRVLSCVIVILVIAVFTLFGMANKKAEETHLQVNLCEELQTQIEELEQKNEDEAEAMEAFLSKDTKEIEVNGTTYYYNWFGNIKTK